MQDLIAQNVLVAVRSLGRIDLVMTANRFIDNLRIGWVPILYSLDTLIAEKFSFRERR
jgi:hypothetical protein